MTTELKQDEEECKGKRYKTEVIMQRRRMGPEWRYEKLKKGKKGKDEKL